MNLNNMPQAVESTLSLYTNDSYILYQHNQLNKKFENIYNWFVDKNFENICDWFLDNKH